MKTKPGILAMVSLLVLGLSPLWAQTDAEGCKDHPLFSRMPNFYIDACEVNDFDSYEFYLDEGKTVAVEGAKTYLSYYIKEGSPVPSELQILRNFINAAQKIAGQVLYKDGYNAYLKIARAGGEFWVHVKACDGADCYQLTIIEKKAMVQEVTANEILDALNSQGFIALDIRFDTGQATIKPESKPIVEQIAAALRDNPSLKVSVEGHTDNTGTPQGNKALSMKRAEAVVAALVQAGIASGRLQAAGWGQEKPVADNRSEEGRAKNRRVEVVKK
ncbi:MAG: OmpA family protein [Acidobacteria bacterium]|nr:OmpA family protein [Acidobacteriota bacterium]